MANSEEVPGKPMPEDRERGDLADENKVKRQDIKGRLKLRQKTQDVEFVLSSKEGRRFVWGLIEDCGVFRSSFTGNNNTFFNEGMRNIGLKVMAEVQNFPEAYLIMMNEAKQEEKNG